MTLLYDGLNALPYRLNPTPLVFNPRAPIPTDWQNFNLGTIWIDTATEDVYMLVSLAGNVATWVLLINGSGNILGITADNAVTAFPVAGIINIFGNGSTITTTAAGNTITLGLSGGIATTYDGNTGSAVPAAGILNIVGDNSLTVSTAAGNTVTTAIKNGSAGQLIIGGTTTAAWANLTAGTGISIATGDHSITISASGVLDLWVEVTGTTQAMAANTGYIANNAGVVTLTLPSTATLGTRLTITGKGSGGWLMAQNAGQTVYYGIATTTPGAGGSLASTQQRDTIDLVCITANTEWNVINSVGNITVV
jgi:hypothetical protein